MKTTGHLQERAGVLAGRLWYFLLAVAVVFLVATRFATDLYNNYYAHPFLFAIPVAAVVGLVLIKQFLSQGKWWAAWFASSAAIVFSTLFGVAGLYPNMIPLHPGSPLQSHRFQLLFHGPHPQDHAGGGPGFRAYSDCLPGLDLQAFQGQGH